MKSIFLHETQSLNHPNLLVFIVSSFWDKQKINFFLFYFILKQRSRIIKKIIF
jgi:hypothetical protein